MPQITPARLRMIDARWKAPINKFRGAAPVGLAVAHIVAESNGDPAPVVRTHARAIGLTGLPLNDGTKYGYTEEQLEDPATNIYVWGLRTNADSAELHKRYPDNWTEPNYDFWLAVRLVFVVGFTNLVNMLKRSGADTQTDNVTAAFQGWVRASMPTNTRFGTFNHRNLHKIATDLDLFKQAMTLLDGPGKVGAVFTAAPALTPGGDDRALRTARL